MFHWYFRPRMLQRNNNNKILQRTSSQLFSVSSTLQISTIQCILKSYLIFVGIIAHPLVLLPPSIYRGSWPFFHLRNFKRCSSSRNAQRNKCNDHHLFSGKIKGLEKLSGVWCNCCNFARCLWCPKPAPSEETIKFEAVLAKLEEMDEKVLNLLFSP